MLALPSFLKDAIKLLFPHHCAGCGSDIIADDHFLCLKCISQLPHTRFEKIAGNPVEKIFSGRADIQHASSQFYFSKGHLVQQLIHLLKYKGSRESGEYLGAIMGRSLLESGRFNAIDLLIPLPLYADKEFKRGYNQAEVICNGMSSTMNIPVHTKNVVRKRFTETQTKKHRAERWENVEGSFCIIDPAKLTGKKVLLVDDVITTGATLEACGQVLLKIPDLQLSIASLAIASK